MWPKFSTDWHSVGKFSDRNYERKIGPKKFQNDFLIEIFRRKNPRDQIVTDEMRSEKYSDRVSDWLFSQKECKMWQKNVKKYFIQNFQNLVTNSVTNFDQLYAGHNFRSKKSMKYVKKYYGHNFQKSVINSITNCAQLCVGHNVWSKKSMKSVKKYYGHKFGHKFWPTMCQSQFPVKQITCFVFMSKIGYFEK